MPASIALRPAGVICLPSAGRITSTSTFWLISESIWLAWVAASLLPSVMIRLTSEYFLASLRAFWLIALSQPWSACGPAKPTFTVLPGWAFAAFCALLLGAAFVVWSALLVHAASAPAPRIEAPARKPLRGTPDP